jgi:hypothetical protein
MLGDGPYWSPIAPALTCLLVPGFFLLRPQLLTRL